MVRLDRIFKALADPTRLRILNLLLDGPGCVCEMEPVLQMSQPLISRHMANLRNAGLVLDRRQGMRVNYSIQFEGPEGAALAELLRLLFRSRDPYQADLEKWRHKAASADCDPRADGQRKRTDATVAPNSADPDTIRP